VLKWKLDNLEVAVVSGGRMRIDGGAMFGVVPRAVWARAVPPDEAHRIQLDTNCLLIRAGDRCAIVDTGYGSKGSDRDRRNFALEEGEPLVRNLAALGVEPAAVDTVILTHLHFDHVGGCTRRTDAGQIEPVFASARHVVQRSEWDDAIGGAPEFASQYFTDDFAVLADRGMLEFLDGDAEVMPGVTCRHVGGHTSGHQIISLGEGDRPVLYLADLCPTTAHLPTMWSMAYDLFPLDVRRTKPRIFAEAIVAQNPVLFAHDSETKGAWLEERPGGLVALGRKLDGTEHDLRRVP